MGVFNLRTKLCYCICTDQI